MQAINYKLQHITSGEAHAYMVYQLLSQHRVTLVPDFWLIILAAILGKWAALPWLKQESLRQQRIFLLGGATGFYVIVGLQAYIWSISIPLVLPSAIFWFYVLSIFVRRHYA